METSSDSRFTIDIRIKDQDDMALVQFLKQHPGSANSLGLRAIKVHYLAEALFWFADDPQALERAARWAVAELDGRSRSTLQLVSPQAYSVPPNHSSPPIETIEVPRVDWQNSSKAVANGSQPLGNGIDLDDYSQFDTTS